MRNRALTPILAALVLLAGCGSAGSLTSSGSSATGSPPAAVQVQVTQVPPLGAPLDGPIAATVRDGLTDPIVATVLAGPIAVTVRDGLPEPIAKPPGQVAP